VRSPEKGESILVFSAKQASGDPYDEAKNAAAMGHKKNLEALSVGGKLFWKTESEQKTVLGKMHSLHYTASLRGFILDVSLISYDEKLTDELTRSVESIQFFDPARAKEIAGTGSQPYLPAAARVRLASSQDRISSLDPGLASGRMYSNRYLGFSYQVPSGWSAADEATQQRVERAGHRHVFGNDAQSDPDHVLAERCNRILLFATKYPESNRDKAHEDEFNPLILIMASDPNCFPTPVKFPSSIHDQETIQTLGHAIIQSFRGTPLMGTEVTKLRALDVGGHVFIEIPTTAAVPLPDSKLRRKVYMSMVITAIKDYWVCWLFESDSRSGLEELMRTPISFLRNPARVN
jgi:hypothetical protein